MRLYLAPLQGMTNAFYRNTFSELFGGIDVYYAPFVATAKIEKINPKLLKDLFPEDNAAHIKLIPQILGNDGKDFRRFAQEIAAFGYTDFNWNIGCPYPTVTDKKKGSGILPYPDMIERFLDDVFIDDTYPLSVKMRLGMEYPDESVKVIEILNRYPLKEIIAHARTGKQAYSGTVDLDSFERALSLSKHPVIYNGDIFTHEDYLNITERFPSIAGVMLGRGACADPTLPSRIKGRIFSDAERLALLREFHDRLYVHYQDVLSGEKHLCDKMKGVWEYLAMHLDRDGSFLKKLHKCKTAESYNGTVDGFLKSGPAWISKPMR